MTGADEAARAAAAARDILPLYEDRSAYFQEHRGRTLFERIWLDRFLRALPAPRDVLDMGCGFGAPVASYLTQAGCAVTGVDGSAAMVAAFRETLPGSEARHADMRRLALGRRFSGLLAWNSLFHLTPEDQAAMFAVLKAHAAPGAVLMFTCGPGQGLAMGEMDGRALYHASLSPDAYRACMEAEGFEPLLFMAEDPACNGHSVWLARRRGS
ncbi:dTDP-3-amino-3,4, 6-trideoxy-alpha-D-glucopyranose [Pseudoruegeria aquimaris]|uniref:dTDP-3-amino-3,4, 6-trideoxy-alpha-D-glucopyranose n=1 Tax=Pseudoruegeria aquimaris TaxID=393663 RepID=A0A1Y5R8C4_9RHOB|nr:class I SAM-dependent methyltransferase [Pseudoruegeria aquimaris]SLN11481.1 dTDP-3-amino-3,4, 6-trideoxy-alpha-D-glucopyranose [Pseudoruegeria aquimaris]